MGVGLGLIPLLIMRGVGAMVWCCGEQGEGDVEVNFTGVRWW